ncbi:unnamed protein product [Ixodes hexagonus]
MVVYRKDPFKVETDTTATATPIENGSSDEAETLPPKGPTAPEGVEGVGSTPGVARAGVPRAILSCRPNSHPFPERILSLDQPAKVGRSVARCRQAHNNAIFDCKVLSRNHALLWYDNGKFYLQDTKSSNGTFVNNQRLSKGSEESPAQEVCSGDIVQFGVDVVENSRKVTHGCIVATLRLFLPDGKEAKASPSTAVVAPGGGSAISTQELYQLSQYLQEALHREQILQNKMATLLRVVSSTQEATENNWKAMIEEDRLLNRIETLEAQLVVCAKPTTDDKLREEISRLQEERDRYQNSAKESLRKALQEKLEAVRRVQDLEAMVSNEEECSRLREVYEAAQKEIGLLADRSDKLQKEIGQLQAQLKEAEELSQAMAEEKAALESQIEDLQRNEQTLAAKIESLRADNDFSKEQLAAVKARFEQVKKTEYIEDSLGSLDTKDNMPNHRGNQLAHHPNGSQFVEARDGTVLPNSNCYSHTRRQRLTTTGQLGLFRGPCVPHLRSLAAIANARAPCPRVRRAAKVCELEEQLEQLHMEDKEESKPAEYLQAEIKRLQELLFESREKKNVALLEMSKMKEQLEEMEETRKIATERLAEKLASDSRELEGEAALSAQLAAARKHSQDQAEQILRLQEELSRSELSLQELREQLGVQRMQLSEEEQRRKLNQEELSSLQNLLEEERKARDRTESTCETIKKQLHEAQNTAKQHQNESEHLRKKVRSLTEDLRNRTNAERSSTPVPAQEALRDECATLRARAQKAEEEARRQQDENARLVAEFEQLQSRCVGLQASEVPKAVPSERGDRAPSRELLREEDQATKLQLQETTEELAVLKDKFSACAEERAQLQRELKALTDEYQLMSYQSKTISACSIIPLCILLLAVLLGFYPTISFLTGTTEAP